MTDYVLSLLGWLPCSFGGDPTFLRLLATILWQTPVACLHSSSYVRSLLRPNINILRAQQCVWGRNMRNCKSYFS